ncbi:hypothetical protein SAMN04489740_2934 [Arthrobacter alpinus]|uniref:Uncharacterized protein n=1 Tax=Arthrobacter alpinus TaxID=656366 RepID=A0A1H5MHD5_9MICC|nr:hypothetical protein [Arthrobacter alpinus]SEE88500.1 hypothetical protein SAMN04489740_2934 [Arthrobacter alpinus]
MTNTTPELSWPSSGQPEAEPVDSGSAKSPFAAITVRDYITDALALVLLTISLFLHWRLASPGSGGDSSLAAGRIEVLLATIISMLSLGLSYIWRSGAFGTSWNYRKMQDLRLLANAPYLLMVVGYLIVELVNPKGLGTAVAFGLAGAVLAATPRQAELGDPAVDTARDRRWLAALLGLAGLCVLAGLVEIVRFVAIGRTLPLGPLYLMSPILLGLFTPVLFIVVALKISLKSNPWRLVGSGVGAAGLLLAFISLPPASRVVAGLYGSSPTFSVVFWMAFGAIAAAPSLERRMIHQPAQQTWQAVLAAVLKLGMAASAGVALVALVNLIRVLFTEKYVLRHFQETPFIWVFTLILAMLGIAGFVAAAAALKRGTRDGRKLGTTCAAIVFVLFLVLVMVGPKTLSWGLSGPAVILAIVFPVAILAIMWAPKSMREHFGAVPAANAGFSFEGVPRTSVLVAEAANPVTSHARLHELAAAYPQTHAAIASNPSTYPELLRWLEYVGSTGASGALHKD